MKTGKFIGFILSLLFFSILHAQEFNFENAWTKVESLEYQGLPKSASSVTDSIYKKAKSVNNASNLVKAIIYKMKFISLIEEDAFIKNLDTLETEIKTSPFPANSILHSMAAEMYWWYFEHNRYKFYSREKVVGFLPSDIRTWDLNMIADKVAEHYKFSISKADDLLKFNINNLKPILTNYNDENLLSNPTLYDFLAFRAAKFFINSESGLTKPQTEFNIDNDDFFLPADKFVKIKIESDDSMSFHFIAIKILQDIIRFHLNDTNQSALVNADITRLNFINENSTNNLKDTLYLNSLKFIKEKCRDTLIKGEVELRIIQKIYDIGSKYNPSVSKEYKWKKKEAYERLIDFKNKYEDSDLYYTFDCNRFIKMIKNKNLDITIEKENLPQEPFRALIKYSNIDTVYFKIYRTTESEIKTYEDSYFKLRKDNYIDIDTFLVSRFKNREPLLNYFNILPNDSDFQEHSVEVKLPELEKGLYLIIASTKKSLEIKKNEISYGLTTITGISYIQRGNNNGDQEIYVLDRKTGHPKEGADVTIWGYRYDYNSRDQSKYLVKTYKTDLNGYLKIPGQDIDRLNYYLDFSYNNDKWSTNEFDFWNNSYPFYGYSRNDRHTKSTRTFFFTDRAIYRPGQTIYFKGIIIETDGFKSNEIVAGRNTTVELRDVNWQVAESINLTTNEYGTFSGSFTAPSKGLNGIMTIEGDNGRIQISVEDYKRPKFEVKFDTIKNSYKLGETLKVPGRAISYSGASVDKAKVSYRVTRSVNFPWSYYWWYPRPNTNEKQITQGTTLTNEKGEFEITFKAIADKSIDASSNPIFIYEVVADVTDINGETHSTTKEIEVGYKALIIKTNINEKLEKNTKDEIKIISQNLKGDYVSASGNIMIYKVKSPEIAYRKRKWNKPDKFIFSEQEFHKYFPTDIYNDEDVPSTWKIENKVFEADFNTSKSKALTIPDLKSWNNGYYKIIIKSADIFGTPVEEQFYFILFDLENNNMPVATADWFLLLKNIGEPGDKLQLLSGSSYKDVKVLFEIESDNNIIKRNWLDYSDNQSINNIQLKEEYRGNIGLHYTYVFNNRLYNHDETIYVPYTNKKLNIEFETFRNKLQPGEKEEWKLKITGKDREKVAAEMVATLYDASLDAFRPNDFHFNIFGYYRPTLSWNSRNCFESYELKRISSDYSYSFDFNKTDYNLDWFGFQYDMSFYKYHMEEIQRQIAQQKNKKDENKPNFRIISSEPQKGTTISGTVIDANGEKIPGVNVVILGTTKGTTTDLDGKFSISSTDEELTIVVSFLGYHTQEIKLKKQGKVNIEITLEEDIQELNEVRVVGYGVQKKSMLTASVASVKVDNMMDVSTAEENKTASDSITSVEKKKEELSSVKARTNFNETAFFYPNLQTDENGEVIINFTIPEALTKWKMLGFAHTKDLKYGLTENELVTQKELMVIPNAPRFFREGDTINFTVKITSLSGQNTTGYAQLMLFDALTMKPIDKELRNNNPNQDFSISGQAGSTNLTWQLIIPQGIQAIDYRIVAKSGKFSDGEEMTLPVLTNRMLVTETMAIPVKGKGTKTYTLDKLANNVSPTLQNNKLTFEYTANPAWYAIQALPYLMEYPYECAEQVFSRFYANSIASHIANSSPRIKQVFDSWRNITPDALLSNLEKNQELKGLMLEETPWVLEAKDESQRKKNVALLFDLNRMSNELDRAIDKLKDMQVSNGGFPWFQGMPDNRYITQHIICGIGKLDHLGIKNIRENNKIWTITSKAIAYTDERIAEDYQELLKLAKAGKIKLSDNHLSYSEIHYLYARSFYNDIKPPVKTAEAIDYYMGQAKTYWLANNIYLQGMLALALKRNNDNITPTAILKSLKERSLISDEMGMYWKADNGWFWYQAPIETQAMMIEVFDEIAKDTSSVNEMRVWLLKQKQTQDWKTTKATTEACYALLLRGTNWLTENEPDEIKVGSIKLEPSKMEDTKVEAGTGYFKTSWSGSEIKPEMAKVTITKKSDGISWGALYWQYFEQLDKITSAETPLKLNKKLFVERPSSSGPVIIPISDTTSLKPGDLIKVRIELRVDRDMEYVHMKDMRASGFEPVNVLSQYKWQDGLGYYESTRDAATNFFFSWLQKGTYVFEYPLRVSNSGNFSNGITTVQCMYAPEFTSHSEGVRVKVK